MVTMADGTVTQIDEGDQAYRDVAWSPDGERLGLVCGGELGSLHVFWPEEGLGTPLVGETVRRFAGWNRTGRHLAYVAVAADLLKTALPYHWLLLPDPLARDTLFVMSDGEAPPQQPALAGARFTFLQWSPTEPVLSLWITFTPTHRSWYAVYRDTELRPGDPAAVYDPRTGALSWKPVDAHERTQVGHYYLATGNAAQAWRWYEKAEARAAELTPDQRLEAIRNGDDATFFYYVCLTRLGKHTEAAEKLRLFDAAFRPGPNRPPLGGQVPIALPAHRYRHLRDRYAAEVFLSLDAVKEGEEFFRAGLRDAGGDEERLSGALMLSQFLLARQDCKAYADLIAEEVSPLLARCRQTAAREPVDALEQADYLAVLPLASPKFLGMLSRDHVGRLVPRWERLAAQAQRDGQRFALDLILAATYRHLGRNADADAAVRRVRQNPEWPNRQQWLPPWVSEFDVGLR
jgi:hypothetical protein